MNSRNSKKKSFFIQTLGCKVNQYESQAMRERLIRHGLKESSSKDAADLYILNTCTVTAEADKESRQLIGRIHRANRKTEIVVTGCYVEADPDSVLALPGVLRILRNGDKNRIADILIKDTKNEERRTKNEEYSFTITDFKDRTKAFVKIQDGCENFCSYCKVPYVRGVLESKPLDVIIEEVRSLVDNGFKEVVLTGICLGAWGKDLAKNGAGKCSDAKGLSLIDVLKGLENVSGGFRLRLSSIEPKHMTQELIDYISGNARVCRHLHIPLQSGDDGILKKMNRPYTAADYKEMVAMVRGAIKGVAITTDVMIGFPGESDGDFDNTLNFIKDISPARTHVFTFSPRDGTAAGKMDGRIDPVVLKKRYRAMSEAALAASSAFRRNFIGRKLEILVESRRDKKTGLLAGYSDNYIRVLFKC